MLSALVFAVFLPVQPQVHVGVSVGVDVHAPPPVVRFEAEPTLVVVSPGVMVVPDYHDEVFFAGGFYWVHSGGVWFRTRHHHGGWVRVSARYVPRAIFKAPRGKYRHYRGGRPYHRVRAHHRPRHRTVVRVNGGGKVKVRHKRHRDRRRYRD